MVMWYGVRLGILGVPLLVYLGIAVRPLDLRRQRDLDDTRAVRAIAVTGVPIMGAVAFAMLDPAEFEVDRAGLRKFGCIRRVARVFRARRVPSGSTL